MLCDHGNIVPCVECDVEPLKAENESLRARVAELEDGLRVITQYPDVREYVGTICHDDALSALKGSDGAWLLRKQAEAVEKCAEGLTDSRSQAWLMREANQLRTQADALERQSVDVGADHDNQ